MNASEARALLALHAERGVPVRVGVLSNPGSGRNRRGQRLAPVLGILRDFPEVLHREARTPEEISRVLKEFSRQEVELLALNSGDGTVQAALSSLFNEQPFTRIPLLALLRGGSTNVNIGDVGIRGARDKGLHRLLSWAEDVGFRDDQIIQRPVLEVRATPHSAPRYGMVFGAGLITKGIEYYHSHVHNRGIYDGLATGLTTIRMLMAIGRGHPDYATPLCADVQTGPDTIIPAAKETDNTYLLLLASALERLFLGIRPFWGVGSGGIRFTSVHYRPAHLLRALPALLKGRPNRFGTLENGYGSGLVSEVYITMDGYFTLDGELYPALRANGPVSIRQAGPVIFIRP